METQTRPDAVPVQELANRLIHNMETVIMGKHDVIRKAVLCLLANGHILLEDLPGTGKTTLAPRRWRVRSAVPLHACSLRPIFSPPI